MATSFMKFAEGYSQVPMDLRDIEDAYDWMRRNNDQASDGAMPAMHIRKLLLEVIRLRNAEEEKRNRTDPPAVARAIEIVRSNEWYGDMRINMTTVIGAGRVLAKRLDELERAG